MISLQSCKCWFYLLHASCGWFFSMQQVCPFPPLGGLFYHSWVLLNTAECVTCTKQSSLGGRFSAAWTGAKNVTELHPGKLCSGEAEAGWWAQGNYTKGMFRWLSLPVLLDPYFQWKTLFAHGGAGFRFVVSLCGLSPFSTHLQLAKCSDSLLPLDLFIQNNLRGLTEFSDVFRFSNSFEGGKNPGIYFRRCVKCFFFPYKYPGVGHVMCTEQRPAASLDI